ncbi:MAG: amidohydrolase [Pseudomonadales bacterium]|nr:amidohydrolase [Pseudomonadales bacterium]MCP5184659.1 amidohydrolase [Pseudomonadales bacterium]
MSTLTIAIVQTTTAWHDAAANRRRFDQFLASVPGNVSLVLLPEMFTTGFTMQPEQVAEGPAGITTRWMTDWAERGRFVLGGSVVTAAGADYFNRFLWAEPGGGIRAYDKRHCFRMAGEHEHYAAGRTRPVWTVNGGRVRPSVCYDLRFPVWLRCRGDYDVLVCVANWPAARLDAWDALLKARAIENQAFVAGVNILGTDGNGVVYDGGSAVYAPDGRSLLAAGNAEGVFTVDLDLTELAAYRERFPAWRDADRFEVLDAE